MMSIFSPFDAFCAESIGWNVFNFSRRPAPSPATQSDLKSSAASSSSAPTVDECSRRETAIPVKKDAENLNKIDGRSFRKPMTVTKNRNPRFAVELDGLHCFETIIPY